MKLVLTMVVRDQADVVDAQIAYHLNAGIDFVLATDHESRDGTTEILESYEREGYLRLIREQGTEREAEWRTRMGRQAATEHDADWVINADPAEFWWPRGESLKDVLGPIPPRYTMVQGLRRDFLPVPGEAPFAERMTVRRSFERGTGDGDTPERLLRPVFRADPAVVVRADGGVELRRSVPLRAWYPLEVLHFPLHDGEGPLAGDDPSLVEDTRLRDALRALRDASAPGRTFALPANGEIRLPFRVPDIVDDARYAVECAAVGEVDLSRLEQYVGELEQRVERLEQRFWPRVLRRVARLVGGS